MADIKTLTLKNLTFEEHPLNEASTNVENTMPRQHNTMITQ